MAGKTLKMIVLAFAGLSACCGLVYADKAALEDKLEQEIAVKLDDVTIAEALAQIGQKAGVKILLSPEAVWKLPEGQQTRLSVTLEGRLAESLEQMLNSFFMRYAVGSEALTVYPRPELRRIIGRPTAGELRLLKNIYGNKMWVQTSQAEISEQFVQQVLNAMAQEPVSIMGVNDMRTIGAIMAPMGGKSTSSSGSPHDPNSPKGTPLTLASLLDETGRVYRPAKTWYIEGAAFPRTVAEIQIVSTEEFWQAHLDQIVDVSFDNETGEAILRRLAACGDLQVRFAGGSAPADLAQKMTLEVQNAKLVDVLDRAMSVLRSYRTIHLSEGVVEIHPPETAPVNERPQQAASEPPSAGGYVGKISIPMEGGRYFIEFMLRDSDLTEELRKLREQTLNSIMAELSNDEKIREILKQFLRTSPPKE